ncbi:hypothetical protein SLA2020_050040 [Shorea laevis]
MIFAKENPQIRCAGFEGTQCMGSLEPRCGFDGTPVIGTQRLGSLEPTPGFQGTHAVGDENPKENNETHSATRDF